ncbi:FliH/SctL family protein [Chitinispirillales bacterium ANBcel5]|uniref:FliH/SctL family protein n=1 Tax=Cellulosispirillum alkaliphilum TaxID=3039283 RepID=UPI002A53EE9B|nr:FliH/SctL family protein [Chitinispirillales bacterium ANBcel5]
MDNNNFEEENVPTLIDQLLKAKDPASVGLKKILRKKVEEHNDFPLHAPNLESFDTPDKSGILSADERHILELEKKILELKNQITRKENIAKQAVNNAYNKGKKEGVAEGEILGKKRADEEYNAQLEKLQQNILTVLQNLEKSKKEMIWRSEGAVMRVSFAIAKKIIGAELSTNHELVLKVIKKALSSISQKEDIIIRISPQDLETVKKGKEFWAPVSERLKDIVIEEDNRIDKGGCIIESGNGLVDARIDVQMEEINSLIEKSWSQQTEGQSPTIPDDS